VCVAVAVGVTGVWVAVALGAVALGVTGVALAVGVCVLVGIPVAVGVLLTTGVLVEVTGNQPVGVGASVPTEGNVTAGSGVTDAVGVAVDGAGIRCMLGAVANATKPRQ
jgi:hypothetical protein